MICPQRAVLPIYSRVQQPAADRLKRPFGALIFEFELAGSGVGARWQTIMAFKKSAPNGHYYMQWAAKVDQIPQQNSLQRAGGPCRQ
jgi:hypothetical protein